MTTVLMLINFLLSISPDTPLCIAVGKGYKCAPVKAELKLMSPDIRANWYDSHVDQSSVLVLVLSETTRVENATRN